MNAETKETLQNLRLQIDEIDRRLVPLFVERMECAKKIASLKQENRLNIFDEERERQVIENALLLGNENLKNETEEFMKNLLTISKKVQATSR